MATATEKSDDGLRDQATEYTLAANPLVGIREEDIWKSATKLFEQVTAHPALAAKHYFSYFGELGRIAAGHSELAPDTKDKRFVDPAWKDSAAYRALAQNYLAWGTAMQSFVDEARMDKLDTERSRFIVSLVVDAMSPTNTIIGNPAALKTRSARSQDTRTSISGARVPAASPCLLS
jgi:polyhydroxyalkanoate synthase